ncbi:MAG TPA: glutamine--fructose-6-phosphate transaminase (isomerizing) [Candidatus Tripitaka californicus]|uniref:glutamine--fructose-6-phosphate transaminase (isomerizing) n=2 Tax=Candidatus Tripitaka californicus TaxID=3367616 RepID=UPI004026BED8|nr:glutamine--fructose-6-phosphate transaminase (isomerizing) [Planctomycetota bacterium]
MCGIVGYVGHREALPILLDGLKRLEYRGYDSAGVALLEGGEIHNVKSAGRIESLEAKLKDHKWQGPSQQATIGIAHTRWATHGPPTSENAHPHLDCHGKIALVHNGIIENYEYLKAVLLEEGYAFSSDTDTEVLVHLIEKYYRGDLASAVRSALQEVEGTYGIAVLCVEEPDKLVVARDSSPMLIGLGQGEYFAASDVAAILEHTRKIVYLENGEVAVITRNGIITTTGDGVPVRKKVEEIHWNLEMIEKSGHHHFMHKEIHEQPRSILNALRGRVDEVNGRPRLGMFFEKRELLDQLKRVIILGCGTSWHAGLVGEYMMEELARIPVEVEYASEFRYRDPILEEGTVAIAISQSGETADTLSAMKEAKRRGATTLAICNVVGSSIAREAEGGVYLHAGPEIGVASTKAFTSQLAVLYLLTLAIARARGMEKEKALKMLQELNRLPEQVETILQREEEVIEIARLYKDSTNFLYLGRGYNFPAALEGALKLKEVSYIHAEGYPAAEMKHGPIALISPEMPVVFIATRDRAYGKILTNIEEVKARGGRIIAIATEGDLTIKDKVDHVFYIPQTIDPLVPVLSVVPLQLLAYHIAVMKGCDVDKPRNLAKSVTVE